MGYSAWSHRTEATEPAQKQLPLDLQFSKRLFPLMSLTNKLSPAVCKNQVRRHLLRDAFRDLHLACHLRLSPALSYGGLSSHGTSRYSIHACG